MIEIILVVSRSLKSRVIKNNTAIDGVVMLAKVNPSSNARKKPEASGINIQTEIPIRKLITSSSLISSQIWVLFCRGGSSDIYSFLLFTKSRSTV